MRAYVAGPMSGIADYNHPAFNTRAAELRAGGHFVVNPAEMDAGVDLTVFPDHDTLWRDCMLRDLAAIGKHKIDAMVMLEGWENSKGACLEHHIAQAMGMSIFYPGDTVPDHVAPRNPRIVGLSGWGRTGKDSTAAVLVSDYGFEQGSFADPLRIVLRGINPTVPIDGGHWRLSHLVRGEGPGDVEDWNTLKSLTDDARRMMVALGDGIRGFDPDFWLDQGMALVNPASKMVFADVRNPNEADAIRARGGVVFRVDRPGVGPACDPVTGQPYRLETALDDYRFDAVILNDGTLDDLDETVAEVMEDFAPAPEISVLRPSGSVTSRR